MERKFWRHATSIHFGAWPLVHRLIYSMKVHFKRTFCEWPKFFLPKYYFFHLSFQKGFTSRPKNDDDEANELNFKIFMSLSSSVANNNSNNNNNNKNNNNSNNNISNNNNNNKNNNNNNAISEIVLDEMLLTISLQRSKDGCGHPGRKIPTQVRSYPPNL